MSLILNIDTANELAQISIAGDGATLEVASNTAQKEHGGFLQPAIDALLKKAGVAIKELDAIALSAGPGSYTGLRVGMASAKGLCYALNLPLITIGTLEILALSAILQTAIEGVPASTLMCPMIDARRMEVFTALYNQALETVIAPCALVLEENFFANSMLKNKILFFGNGAHKWQRVCKNENAQFISVLNNPLAMSKLTTKKYLNNEFASLAYSEPFYIKEFFGGAGTGTTPAI